MWEHPETESSRKEFENAVRIFQDELEQRNGIIQGATLCAGSILCTLSVTLKSGAAETLADWL
jgi:hypothetical protein